jgi:hypothetical protein
MTRDKDCRTPVEKAVEKYSKQATKDKKTTLRKMKAKANRISKKWTYLRPVDGRVLAENSNSRAPKLMMYALTNHPGSDGAPQTFRAFETVEDLTNPDNLFILVDELIEVLEEDFAEVALLNQTAKVVYAAERKLQKVLNE